MAINTLLITLLTIPCTILVHALYSCSVTRGKDYVDNFLAAWQYTREGDVMDWVSVHAYNVISIQPADYFVT
jgi:hypothetical protein